MVRNMVMVCIFTMIILHTRVIGIMMTGKDLVVITHKTETWYVGRGLLIKP